MNIIDICNRALGFIHQGYISSLEENNKEAILCKFLYPIIKRELLFMYHWKCSLKNTKLTSLANVKDNYDYKNVFLLPVDCIKIIKTSVENDYLKTQKYIYCDAQELKIYYVADIPENIMSLGLLKLLSLKLAIELQQNFSDDIAANKNLRAMFEEEYKQQINSDSKEGTSILNIDVEEESSWINARKI